MTLCLASLLKILYSLSSATLILVCAFYAFTQKDSGSFCV